jgi:AcrR family transcriptional regulator
MPDDTHPTRSSLLDAGLTLAESGSLGATSVDDVVRAAGVSKGTFYVHFKDRTSYLVALHRRFYAELGAAVRAATEDLPLGGQRLSLGAEAYLDSCLRSRGVKAMLLDVRGEPAIAAEVAKNIDAFVRVAAEDFAAIDTPNAAAAARLFVAMVQEVALAEMARGRPETVLRQALWHLARATPPAARRSTAGTRTSGRARPPRRPGTR